MSCTAVRLVLKRLAEARYMPQARGFGSTSSATTREVTTSTNTDATNPSTRSATRSAAHANAEHHDLVIITGQGRGSADGRPVIQPAIMVGMRMCCDHVHD